MKKFLILCLSILFISPLLASGIGAGATSATCDNATLETYNGTANVEIDWQPNTINLNWYDGDTKLNVQNSAQTCNYDGALTVPTTPPSRTGYTFKGWELKYAIPAEYTELQYIESTGTQWIDTGIIGNQNTKVDIDFQVTNDGYFFPFGSRIEANIRAFAIWSYSGGVGSEFRVGFDGTNGYKGPNVAVGDRYHVVHSKDGTYVNNDKVWTASGWSNFTTPGTLSLFAVSDQASCVPFCYTKMRAYYLKLYENNSLLMDLIPVRRNSDGVLGMYDTVTQTFFTNAGTGTFTAGPAVQ